MVISKVAYLERWLKVLDVVIEKVKGLLLGKIRIMQLIKADLQLKMRIFVDVRRN